jgi:carboxylate-amine ligase
MTSFARSEPFTVGVEEELLLVDAETLRLVPAAVEVLAGMDAGDYASHEIYAATIELRSRPSSTVEEAVSHLAELRASAQAAGATLLAAGVHPDGEFGDAEHVTTDRYKEVGETMRGLLRRTPECALHVHVGMPDLETAIRVFNGLRGQIPILQGLAAASPFWFGRDSGLASARGAHVRPYPGRGIPRPLRDGTDWSTIVEEVLAVGELDDPTFLWWDVRLNPRHGTVEVRELDAQASLYDVAALAALVRGLAREAADAPAPLDQPTAESLAWSAFRAIRDGASARILDNGGLRPLDAVARTMVDRLRPIAAAMGDGDALSEIFRTLDTGGSAERQRRTFADGRMRGLLKKLADETAGGYPPFELGCQRPEAERRGG